MDEEDVRRIALSLAGVTEEPGSGKFAAADRVFASPYREKVHPKKPRVERRDIYTIQTESEQMKFALIEAEPDIYFTTDHYNGYAAVQVRLASIPEADLRALLEDARDLMLRAKPKRSRNRQPKAE